MDVTVSKLGVVTYLTPQGALVRENLTEFESCIRVAESDGPANIVIDMENAGALDSKGLELLLDLNSRLNDSGGSLRLSGLNKDCRDILALTRLDKELVAIDKDENLRGAQS